MEHHQQPLGIILSCSAMPGGRRGWSPALTGQVSDLQLSSQSSKSVREEVFLGEWVGYLTRSRKPGPVPGEDLRV